MIWLWNAAPSTIAGRKPRMISSAKRRAAGSVGNPISVLQSLRKYNTISARIAPSWIITSKVLPGGA